MFKTLAAAEQAAIEGHGGDEWDTQRCNNLADLFSSSPAPPPAPPDWRLPFEGASAIKTNAPASNPAGAYPVPDATIERSYRRKEGGDGSRNHLDLDSGEPPQSLHTVTSERDESQLAITLEQPLGGTQDADLTSQASKEVLRRGSQGKERPEEEGTTSQIPRKPANEKGLPVTQALRFLAAMDIDYTQRSALSLTQENSSSAYERLDVEIRRYDPPPCSDPAQVERHTQVSSWRNCNSEQAESTAQTYKEHDTGHITISFDEPGPHATHDGLESQDESFAPPNLGSTVHGHPLLPETPAPPVNPFSYKGSVMKGFEMFGATQPSSVGLRAASPTSTRPSPDIYNDFTSPAKCIVSSPLARRKAPEEEANTDGQDRTPLQSSIRNLLAQSTSTDSLKVPHMKASSSRPSDGLQRASSFPEPRRYKSLQESQERRWKDDVATSEGESEGSDFEVTDISIRRKLQREKAIQRQLGAVSMPSNRPRSSSAQLEHHPDHAAFDRKRSSAEYQAQSTSFDAKDTQQDGTQETQDGTQAEDTPQEDVIANSQSDNPATRDPIEIPSSPPRGLIAASESSRIELPRTGSAQSLETPAETQREAEHVPATEPESLVEEVASTSKLPTEAAPSLLLREVDANGQSLRTPVASKQIVHSDQSEDAVPETSPAGERIRPIGEISISFDGGVDEDFLQHPPGFTQDHEFLVAINSPALSVNHRGASSEEVSEAPIDAKAVSTSISKENPTVSSRAQNNHQSHPIHAAGKMAPAAVDKDQATRQEEQNGKDMPTQNRNAKRSELEQHSEMSATPHQREPPTVLLHELSNVLKVHDDLNANSAQSSNAQVENAAQRESKVTMPSLASPKRELRTEVDLKGPLRALRRSTGRSTPSKDSSPSARTTKFASPKTYSKKQPTRSSEHGSLKSARITKASTQLGPREATLESHHEAEAPARTFSALRSIRQQSASDATSVKEEIRAPVLSKRTQKRKSGAISLENSAQPTPPSRASKRQSTARILRESSEDPLSVTVTTMAHKKQSATSLFSAMAFAVSYLKHEEEKDAVIKAISENGGDILQDGFDSLFDAGEVTPLSLTSAAKSVGFAAVIADEHSRKPKYMQALALGLPCISGRWILNCVAKRMLLDWSQYLLCAGQSTFLNGAHLSRKLSVYPAAHASLQSTLADRARMLDGKSILVVTGKSKNEKRKTFLFLTRALGPDRVAQVADYLEARKKLAEAESEGHAWDLLYVDAKDKPDQLTVFGAGSAKGSRKRKADAESAVPATKKIRLLNDEDVVQSLIFGELIDE